MNRFKFRWFNGQKMISHKNIDVLLKNSSNLKGLSQFSGMSDMDGVEIYDGDRISIHYAPQATCIGIVVFERGAFYFKTKDAKPNICLLHETENDDSIRVIGNIYED